MEKSKTAPAERGTGTKSIKARSNGAILIISALDMSWRLAFAVLVPIIGGYELDKHLGSTPALTITGFLLAMAGLFFILRRTMARANEKFMSRTPK
jgi:F0F1-type ATP synthase assembly protein I